MKKYGVIALSVMLMSCDVSINKNDGDASDTTKLDTILEKIDTTIDKGVDTLQKKLNDLTDRDKNKKDTTKR